MDGPALHIHSMARAEGSQIRQSEGYSVEEVETDLARRIDLQVAAFSPIGFITCELVLQDPLSGRENLPFPSEDLKIGGVRQRSLYYNNQESYPPQ